MASPSFVFTHALICMSTGPYQGFSLCILCVKNITWPYGMFKCLLNMWPCSFFWWMYTLYKNSDSVLLSLYIFSASDSLSAFGKPVYWHHKLLFFSIPEHDTWMEIMLTTLCPVNMLVTIVNSLMTWFIIYSSMLNFKDIFLIFLYMNTCMAE